MSIGLLWLALIIFIPVVGLYVLKANAAPVFLGLCLGYVILVFDSHSANLLAGGHAVAHLRASTELVDLALLLIPPILTLAAQINTVHAHKKYLNLLPALGVGLFAALTVVPQLPHGAAHSIMITSYWLKLTHYQSAVIGASGAIAIISFWINARHGESKKHHSKPKA